MGYQVFALFPEVVTFQYHRHDGVIALVGLHVGQQHNHSDVTGYGEDIDRCRRLLSDIDLLVRYVVAYGKCCGYADPAGEQQSWVLESASQGQHRQGEVGIDGIDG